MKSALDKIFISMAGAVALAILVSIIIIFISAFSADTNLIHHFFKYLFPRYIKDTFIVLIGVVCITTLLGTSLGYICSNFTFFASKFLNVTLMLPLSIPSYILAFIYVGVMDYDGVFENIFGFRLNIFNIYGAIFILSISLYPYVYMFCRASFLGESRIIFDLGKMLNLNKIQIFYKIAVFVTKPAIISGVMLVVMETLSDYGTAAYLGIDTFSAGIFRLWFDLGDIGSSSILSSILVIFIFTLMAIEYKYLRKRRYSLNANSNAYAKKTKLKGIYNFAAFLYTFSVSFVGFLLPFLWLLYWGLGSQRLFDIEFYKMAFNSLKVAIISTVIITVLAFMLNYAARISKHKYIELLLLKCSSIGYATPGAVIAISMLTIFMWISNLLDIRLLGVSIIVLIVGYVIRFLATSMMSFESGYLKIHKNIDDAAKIMELNSLNVALKIHSPLLKHFFILSFIIVFVDVIKELPLSLILRPFDYETLSIRAFFYATDERVYDACLPALLIVLISFVALLYIELRRKE